MSLILQNVIVFLPYACVIPGGNVRTHLERCIREIPLSYCHRRSRGTVQDTRTSSCTTD